MQESAAVSDLCGVVLDQTFDVTHGIALSDWLAVDACEGLRRLL